MVPFAMQPQQQSINRQFAPKNDPKRGQHIQNAIKYSTSLWPLFLSAYQKTIAAERASALEPLLILLLL